MAEQEAQGQDLELVMLILIYCSSLWRILLDSSLWVSAGLDIRNLGMSSLASLG